MAAASKVENAHQPMAQQFILGKTSQMCSRGYAQGCSLNIVWNIEKLKTTLQSGNELIVVSGYLKLKRKENARWKKIREG